MTRVRHRNYEKDPLASFLFFESEGFALDTEEPGRLDEDDKKHDLESLKTPWPDSMPSSGGITA